MLIFDNELNRNVASKDFVEFIDAFQLKHNTIPYILRARFVQHPLREEHWSVRFYDTRFPSTSKDDELGSVAWVAGNRSPNELAVTSRLIQNGKYSGWSSEYHQQRTKDVKKAVKIALLHIKPFEWHEVLEETRSLGERHHGAWANEDGDVRRAFNIDHDTFAEEVQHLISQGVVFKTQAFNRLANAMPTYLQYKERQNTPANMDSVLFFEDKIILLKRGHILEPQYFKSLDEMPEGHRTKLSLLKIAGDNQYIPEVGFRHTDAKFVVYA